MMLRLRAVAAGLAGATLLCAVPALAQNTHATPADKQFVKWAIETNNAEIAAGRLALRETQANDVRAFAERMIHDHTMLNEQMKPVAAELGVSVAPGQVNQHQQQLANKLKALRGNAFDRKYIPAMVRGHRKALQRINKEIASTNDMTVKVAAEKAKPIIQEHLQLAQQMAQNHNIHVPAKKHAESGSSAS